MQVKDLTVENTLNPVINEHFSFYMVVMSKNENVIIIKIFPEKRE